MFGFGNKIQVHPIDQPIKRLLDEMEIHGPDAPEYDQWVDQLERLTKLKQSELKPRISPDTLVYSVAHVLGIALVIGYEQKHVMTSKAPWNILKMNPQNKT